MQIPRTAVVERVLTIQRLRREYGSVREAIAYYAGMGCSVSLASRSLGMCRQTLLKWAERFGIDFPRRRDMLPECRNVGHPWYGGGRPRKYSDEEIIRAVRDSRTMVEMEKKGIPRGTTQARFGLTWTQAKAKFQEER